MALVAGMCLATTTPALAECGGQPNQWPAFTEVAPTAQVVIVGTVHEGPFYDGRGATPVFRVHVDEVLRGTAADVVEVSGLRTGLPLEGPQSCRQNAYLYAGIGHVIALAFDGRLPGVSKGVNSAAWIEGRPNRHSNPRVQQLTLDEVRYFASLPDTATGSAGTDSSDTLGYAGWHPYLIILAAAGGLAISRRLRVAQRP